MANRTSRSNQKELEELLVKFVKEMKPLDIEVARVLRDNLWDLYIQSGNKEELMPLSQFFNEHEIKDYVVTVLEWQNMQQNNDYSINDGDAYYGTDLSYSNVCAFTSHPPDWATHVVLFPK